ncbi:MAG: hypothetical protein KKE62_10080, partial [Proteobacteria bacterium]|nr:hypothetical protein [Pseudomonadota bacterium]MBU1543175.1 hypothetical protein [Pseudomonadota bacterium]
MTLFKTKIKYFVIFASVCIILGIALLPFVLTWTGNSTYVKNKISDHLYKQTNIRIHSSEFSLTLFPKPGIKLNSIDIQPDPETRIKINAIHLNLDLFTLMQGKLNLGEIIIDHPKFAIPLFKDSSADSVIPFSISQYAKKINAGFDLLPENQSDLDIVVKNATSEYFEDLEASVTLNKNQKDIRITATIKNILFPQAWLSHPEFKKHFNIDTVTIGQIQLQAQMDNAQSIQGSCQIIEPAVSAENKKKLFVTDRMNLSFFLSEKSQQIKLEQMDMMYPDGLLGIDFSNHVDQKKSSLVFSGKAIPVNQAKEMSSLMFKDIYVARTLFDILLDGQVPQVEVSFKSKSIDTLLNGNNLELSGIIQNGRVHIPHTPLIASDIDGTATVKDGVLNINTTRGVINGSRIETGSLMVDLLNYEQVPFNGEFNLDVDLSTLPRTLVSILPGTRIAKELLKVHQVKGRCKSVLNLEFKDGYEDVLVRVRTKNFPVSGQYERIPGNIVLNNISVDYKPDQITLNNASGTINNTVFTNLYATIGLGQIPYVNIHKGSGIINLESAIPWLMSYPETQKIIAPVKEGTGKIFLSSISLSGPAKKIKSWKYNISGNMDSINLSTVKNQKQIQHLSCNYTVLNKRADLENIKAKIYSLDPLTPYLPQKYLDSIQTPIELNNASLKTMSRPSVFKGNFIFSNGPELKIDLQGDTFASLRLNTAH